MFKLHNRKSRVETRDGATTPGVIHGGTASGRRSLTPAWWRSLTPFKRVLLLIAMFVVVSSVGYVVGEWVKYDRESKIPSRMIPTEKQYLSSHLDELLANPPVESAPSEVKAAYYDDLTLTYADQKQYAKAVESFKKREAISTDGIAFYDYLNIAQYQAAAGDKASALSSLDKAERLLPADDPATGFSRSETLAYLETLRKEYSQ